MRRSLSRRARPFICGPSLSAMVHMEVYSGRLLAQRPAHPAFRQLQIRTTPLGHGKTTVGREIDKGSLSAGRLRVNPDGKRFFTADEQASTCGTPRTGNCLHTFPAGKDERGRISRRSSLRMGKQLLVFGFQTVRRGYVDPDGKLVLQTLRREISWRQENRWRTSFPPDGKRLLTWDRGGKVVACDLKESKLLRTIEAAARKEPVQSRRSRSDLRRPSPPSGTPRATTRVSRSALL